MSPERVVLLWRAGTLWSLSPSPFSAAVLGSSGREPAEWRRGVFAVVGEMAALYGNNHVKQLTTAACDHRASVRSAAFPLHGVNEAERENSLSRVT